MVAGGRFVAAAGLLALGDPCKRGLRNLIRSQK